MHLLHSLMNYLTFRGAHNQQKRTALHLLAASGVVRPGNIEIRYPTLRRRHSSTRAAIWDRPPTNIA